MNDADNNKNFQKISSNLITMKKRADFLRLNKSKTKWVSGSVIVQTAPNHRVDAQMQDQEPTTHYGITITKKIFKSAVQRNRVKRRLRAAAQEIMAPLALTTQDYVLIGRKSTLSASYDTIKKDLKWCLKRLGCLQNANNKHKKAASPLKKPIKNDC